MILVDGILLFPLHGALWILQKVHEAAEEELAGEPEAIKADLGDLHRMFETGRITAWEFDVREKELLDRLDAISERDRTMDSTRA